MKFTYRYYQGTLLDDPFPAPFGPPYKPVYDGEVRADTPFGACDKVWREHNADSRPRAKEIRSMSMGDVVVLRWREKVTSGKDEQKEFDHYRSEAFIADDFGWKTPEKGELVLGENGASQEPTILAGRNDSMADNSSGVSIALPFSRETTKKYRYDTPEESEVQGSLYVSKDDYEDGAPDSLMVTVEASANIVSTTDEED